MQTVQDQRVKKIDYELLSLFSVFILQQIIEDNNYYILITHYLQSVWMELATEAIQKLLHTVNQSLFE